MPDSESNAGESVDSSRRVRCSDVLERAIALIESGPLPESHRDHGEWCPYCAISLAKSQLDEERGTGLDLGQCFEQVVFGLSELESDEPLIEARERLGTIEQPFTRDATLGALRAALTPN